MKKYKYKILSFILTTILFPLGSYAENDNFIFTYDYDGASHDLFGIQRKVQIDAAMALKDPSLIGCEILGISIDIPSKEGCECDPSASAWLTKKLQVDGEFNSPDITEVHGTIINHGTESEPELRLEILFPESYKLTDEGVYVGYSITVKNCNVPGSGWTAKYPIYTVCNIDTPESFMIHCTQGESSLPQKYPEWVDLGKNRHQALAMRVLMRGKRMKNAASLQPLHTLYATPGTHGHVYANLYNHGTEPISSIEYSYTYKSESHDPICLKKELKLDTPIQSITGAYTIIDLPFETPEAIGKHTVDLFVEKVNSITNEYAGSSVLDVEVVPFLPINRPIVEDYTALWCGFCPAVYVAVKRMHDKYGEDFLSMAYHVSDNMQGVESSEFPTPNHSLPSVYINDRNERISNDKIEYQWLLKRRELAPADIDVKIYWDNAERTTLRAESTVRFVYDDPDANYRLAYAMVEDEMSDPTWTQANEYMDSNFEGPYWDFFCGQPFRVSGLIFDDVIVNFPFTTGIEDSLPSSIDGDTEYSHSSVFDLKDGVCKYPHIYNYGESIIKNPDKIRIVALLIDGKTGNVCNAASSGYSGDAQILDIQEGVELVGKDIDDSEVSSLEYFTLDGVRLNRIPENSPFIIVRHMADGSILTEKKVR